MDELPESVRKTIAEHHALYLRDPEAAHVWDPIVIGVPGGPVRCLLLFHTGRKSGKRLYSVLQYYEWDGKIAIVASKGGAARNPAWYANLVANPSCEVWIGASRSAATARTAAGDERTRWWDRVTREQPVQLEYQARTAREIPVVVLERERQG